MMLKDWICNYLGVERAVNQVAYNGSAKFKMTSLTEYTLNGTSYGQFKSVGSLNYLKVYAAGHEVAYYREYCLSNGLLYTSTADVWNVNDILQLEPEISLQAFKQIMQKKPLVSS